MLVIIKMNAQMSDTFTTVEYNDNVCTQNNTTKINLFDINFNGEKFPINLVYSHKGIMVNQTPSSVGIGWEIENIGKITKTVNDQSDDRPTGWFNTVDSNYQTDVSANFYPCTSLVNNQGNFIANDCPGLSGIYDGNDLSPDFFSFNTSNGLKFDFLYKKKLFGNMVGIPTPVILSNFKDYIINTNFSNFYHDDGHEHSEYGDIVFNIIDTNGDKYDFINGLDNLDPNRSFNANHRNDYYLSSITNPSVTNEVLTVNYRPVLKDKTVYFSTGFSDCPLGVVNCNTITDLYTNYFTISENRYDMNQIITKNSIINFIYTNDDYLDEIEIKDLSGNYISGYKFSYIFNPFNNRFLSKVEKYNNDKSVLQTLFQFDYYDANLGIDNSNPDRLSRDFFGYFNNTYQQNNLLPYPIGTIPAADLNPNLIFARYYSLRKITNKFSGTTEFDYKLKTDVCSVCGGNTQYGGGIIINSKTITSNSGNPQYIKYDYANLEGNVVDVTDPKFNYAREVDNYELAWTSRLELFNNQHWYNTQQQEIYPIQRVGNFYNKVIESVYDFQNMNLLSKTIREYEPNAEGIFLTPQLKKETFLNSSNATVKENYYYYSSTVADIIESAQYRCEIRNLTGYNGVKKFTLKDFVPIKVNRTNLIEKREILNTNSGSLTTETYLNYVSSISNLLRSKTEVSSTGINIEERFYYPNDIQVGSEPYTHELQDLNRIGIPIKSESYYGAEKITEIKTVLANDSSTSNLLQLKYLYAKKGTDANSTLERKVTYDSYDDMGNMTQYTQENGVPIAMIWGYNKTKLIAKIENLTYSSIPSSLITAAQNASDIPNNESNVLTALNNIRTDISVVNGMVSTYTYIPLVGISTATDPKGDKIVYSYDKFGRIQNIRDKNNNILTENEYNYKP
jgi:hypothetical protein